MPQEKAHGRSFQFHPGLRPFGQAVYELGRTIAVEIVRDNQVLLSPLRKLCRDGPFPTHCLIGIASGAKLLEKRLDLVVKQTL
jgi:hypothetical protein